MKTEQSLIFWVEKLTGRKLSPLPHLPGANSEFPATGLGHSQFNEYMLAVQANRVSRGFFEFVFGGPTIDDFRLFRASVDAYRQKAMLRFGSFVHAFDVLSKMDRRGSVYLRKQNRATTRWTGRHCYSIFRSGFRSRY